MSWINNINIRRRLNLALGLVVLVIFISIGAYVLTVVQQKITSDADLRMYEQVDDLHRLIDQQIERNQKLVGVSMAYADEYFTNLGSIVRTDELLSMNAVNQVTKAELIVEVNKWELDSIQVQENFEVVDAIQHRVGGTATIFQRINQGFLRVSTNVIKTNGERAVGTYIPNSSPVIQAINSGETFVGRAFVVNAWYLTVYKPIIVDGEIDGILYVGVKEKDLDALRTTFTDKVYYETGYPFIIDAKGNFIIHPNKVGENAMEAEFFNKISNANKQQGSIEYTWEGKQKVLYFNHVKSIDSYVAVSLYKEDLLAVINKIRNGILIALVIGLAIFLAAITLIVKSITDSLQKGVSFAQRIAEGDLTKTLDIDQKDEIGQLAIALNGMVKNIKDIVGGMIDGANNVASASQQMSTRSEEMSQGANEQAASVEQVSSTMEEMASNIEQNTDNAKETESVSSGLQSGITSVNDKSFHSLDSTRKISEKIQIINDIAFQTNILALNAAVEAARAGEHGKGFAVVAAEVRKLAEHSKVAANEIVDLANTTLTMAEETGEGLRIMLPEVQKTNRLVQEIAAGSLEQNNGAVQINAAIQQLNTVTQQNAAASEEMATGAEELSAQATQLEDLISFFKV